MSTIAQKLSDLAQVKSDIAAAIVAKGVSVDPSDTFASYATKISQIPSGGPSGLELDGSTSTWEVEQNVSE